MNKKILALVGAFSLSAFGTAQACEISARVSVVGNEFPAIQTVGAGAAACTGAEVTTNLTSEHQKINVPGMQGNPAEYTSAATGIINCRQARQRQQPRTQWARC